MAWGAGCGSWWGPGIWLGGPLGIIVTVLVWGLVILGLAYLVRRLIHQPGGPGAASSEVPLAILKRRFAAGEIGEEEFRRMRAELG